VNTVVAIITYICASCDMKLALGPQLFNSKLITLFYNKVCLLNTMDIGWSMLYAWESNL